MFNLNAWAPICSYYETDTSKLIADVLTSLGFEVNTGIAKTGVVGVLRYVRFRLLSNHRSSRAT